MPNDHGDAEVEAEWRRVEDQRIAEERAEATEDAAEPVPPPTSRWPWLILAAALAAGILATVAINRPRPSSPEGAAPSAPAASSPEPRR
jgi:hypothetical protein